MSYKFTANIANRAGFVVDSYGNGAAYHFVNRAAQLGVWIDGDSAAQFREDFDTLDAERGGDLHGKDMLLWLWDECGYGAAAEHDDTFEVSA